MKHREQPRSSAIDLVELVAHRHWVISEAPPFGEQRRLSIDRDRERDDCRGVAEPGAIARQAVACRHRGYGVG